MPQPVLHDLDVQPAADEQRGQTPSPGQTTPRRKWLRYDRSEKTITALARLAITLLTARHLASD